MVFFKLPESPKTMATVDFVVKGIPAVSDLSKTVTLHLLIKTFWREPRYSYFTEKKVALHEDNVFLSQAYFGL